MFISKCRYIAPIVVGCFAKVCFSDFYFAWALPFVMFFVLLKCESETTSKQSFMIGYVFGIGYFSGSLYWVHLSFNYVGMASAGIVMNIILVLYVSLFSAAALCLTTFLFKRKTVLKYIFFACSWVLFEYIRGFLFTGFPWNLIGYVTYNIPFFKQIASIVGIYGVSLVYMLIICLLFFRKTWKHSAAMALVPVIYGAYVEIFQDDKQEDLGVDIHIVQPCIEQNAKLNRAMFMNNLNCHLSISGLEEENNQRKKLVIWPEASINSFISDEIIGYISSHIQRDNTYLFFGGDRKDIDAKIHNSSILINKSGTVLATYDKKHLLPFGEFIPEFLMNLGLKKVTAGMINFSRGKNSRLISTDSLPDFSVVICYESVFPGEIVEGARPKWIVSITNDAWFAGSDEIYQHLKATIFRAIEEGVPIFRSANTGISCVIDRKGKIRKILPENVFGIIKTPMSFPSCETVYSKFGNSIFLSGILMMMLICLILRDICGRKNSLRFARRV